MRWTRRTAAALAALPQIESGAVAKAKPGKDDRGAVDKLLGIGGERYQTWPEKAVRGLIEAPEKSDRCCCLEPGRLARGIRRYGRTCVANRHDRVSAQPAMRGAAAATGVAAPTVAEIGARSHGSYQGARELGLQLQPRRFPRWLTS